MSALTKFMPIHETLNGATEREREKKHRKSTHTHSARARNALKILVDKNVLRMSVKTTIRFRNCVVRLGQYHRQITRSKREIVTEREKEVEKTQPT